MTTKSSSNDSTLSEWTILIYQAGDNNLSEECVYALKEMKKVGAPSKVDVLIQFDPSGRGNQARRFHIKQAGGHGTVASDTTHVFKDEIDSSDPETLLDFLHYGIKKAPAEHYMLILSGHGAGTMEGFFLKDEDRPLSLIPRSFPIMRLKDVFTDRNLIQRLGKAKIDILGFDCCMMSTIEVCYELWNSPVLDLLIGSEGFSLNSGWPVADILMLLKKNANYSPTDLAEKIVELYASFYSDYYLGGLSVDQSIIKLSKTNELKKLVDGFAGAMQKVLEDELKTEHYYEPTGRPFQDAILLSHWAAQSYNGEQCVDLYDFCDLLQMRWEDRGKTESVWNYCETIKKLIDNHSETALVLKTCVSGSAFQYSRGVSIYFPWAFYDLDPSYKTLGFAPIDSPWLNFLKSYLRATRRRPVYKGEMRSTPPTSKGPEGRVHSMRNPPTEFPKDYCVGS